MHDEVERGPAAYAAGCLAGEAVESICFGEQREGGDFLPLAPVPCFATRPHQLHAEGMGDAKDGDMPQLDVVVLHRCGLLDGVLSGLRMSVAPHAAASRANA